MPAVNQLYYRCIPGYIPYSCYCTNMLKSTSICFNCGAHHSIERSPCKLSTMTNIWATNFAHPAVSFSGRCTIGRQPEASSSFGCARLIERCGHLQMLHPVSGVSEEMGIALRSSISSWVPLLILRRWRLSQAPKAEIICLTCCDVGHGVSNFFSSYRLEGPMIA